MDVKVTKEQEFGIDKNRKKFDIREEYFVSTSPPLSLLYRFWAVVDLLAAECYDEWGLGAQADTATKGGTRMGCTPNRTSVQTGLDTTSFAHCSSLKATRPRKAISDLLRPQSVLIFQASLVAGVKQEVDFSVTLQEKER